MATPKAKKEEIVTTLLEENQNTSKVLLTPRRSTRKSIKIVDEVILSASTKRRKRRTRKETILPVPKFEFCDELLTETPEKTSQNRESEKKTDAGSKEKRKSSLNLDKSPDSGKGASSVKEVSPLTPTSLIDSMELASLKLSTKKKQRKGSLQRNDSEWKARPSYKVDVDTRDTPKLATGSGQASTEKRKGGRNSKGSSVNLNATAGYSKLIDTPKNTAEESNQPRRSRKKSEGKTLGFDKLIATPDLSALIPSRMSNGKKMKASKAFDETLGFDKLVATPEDQGKASLDSRSSKGKKTKKSFKKNKSYPRSSPLDETLGLARLVDTPESYGSSDTPKLPSAKLASGKKTKKITNLNESLGIALLEKTPKGSACSKKNNPPKVKLNDITLNDTLGLSSIKLNADSEDKDSSTFTIDDDDDDDEVMERSEEEVVPFIEFEVSCLF